MESPLRPTHSSNPPHHSPPCPHYRNRCHWHIPVWKQYPPGCGVPDSSDRRHSPYGFARTRPEARQSPATILRRFQNHNALLS
nr:MAG TPA: hypothetical protein [Caudoviricetes sp.]